MNKKNVLLAIVLLFAIGLRLYSPQADPPPDLSWSGGLWFDEGNQCHNARSKILFNEWFPDEWNDHFYAPILSYIKYAWFKIAGVGLLQERLISHFFAILTLIFYYFIAKKTFSYPFSILALFLLGINYITIMYNRVGMYETPVIFLTVVSLYLLITSNDKKILLFLSGVFSFLVYTFKNLYICFVPVTFCAYILHSISTNKQEYKSNKKIIINSFFILLGIAIVFIIWFATFYIQHREWILYSAGDFIKSVLFPNNFQEAINNTLRYPLIHYYKRMPIIWVCSLLYLHILFRKLIRKEANLAELTFAILFLAHLIFFSFISYRPIRYFVAPIPAMIFMGVSLWSCSINKQTKHFKYNLGQKIFITLFDFIWLYISIYLCYIPLISLLFNIKNLNPSFKQYLILTILTIAIAHLILKLYQKFSQDTFLRIASTKFIIAVLVLLSTILNIHQYIIWQINKTYKVRDISRKLGEDLKDAFIAGLTAPAFNLENRHKSLFLWENFVNYEKPFEKYPLTHAILGLFNKEIHYYYSKWSEIMNRSYLVDVFNLRNTIFHLYAFKEPYIAEAISTAKNSFKLKIVNPSDQNIMTKIRAVYLFNNDYQRKIDDQGYEFSSLEQIFNLAPYENNIEIILPINFVKDPISVLIYLEEPNKRNIFRYEAESLKRETGKKVRDKNASDYFKIVFDKKRHTKGFLGFGPFIPYNKGFIIVKYKLMYKDIERGNKNVALFEVSARHGKKRFAYRHIGGEDLIQDQYLYTTLYFMNPETNELEFRLYAYGGASIDLDCVDIEYYQGYFIPFSNVIDK